MTTTKEIHSFNDWREAVVVLVDKINRLSTEINDLHDQTVANTLLFHAILADFQKLGYLTEAHVAEAIARCLSSLRQRPEGMSAAKVLEDRLTAFKDGATIVAFDSKTE